MIWVLSNPSPFISKKKPLLCPRNGSFLTSNAEMPHCSHLGASSRKDAMAAFSRATKITSRLSAYFRTVLSYRATQPNYSRLLLYLLMDVASVCLAYCTFPCKGLPHSLLCSELSSGRLPHTCRWEGPHNTHSWKPAPEAVPGALQ